MIDLPKDELEAMGIDTVSCYVNMDGKSYSDLDDVFPDDVFRYMDETGRVAQTAAKSPALYADFYRPFVESGHTVIHFTCSSGISAISANTKTAAEEFNGKVIAFDTLHLSNGIALLVKYALELMAGGETDAHRIVELCKAQIPKIQGSFLLETLDCLYKGGRCSGLVYYAANTFKIKPVIHMNEKGQMVVREKFRGSQGKVLEQYIKNTFAKYPNPDLRQLYIVYTTYNKEMEDRIRGLVAKYYTFNNIQFNAAGCNCSIHSGRNTIAMFYRCL
jgi:DegV family protein with EDD domain